MKVDQPLADAHPDDYDALLLPGGLFNPDRLRMNERAVQFVKAFTMTNRPRGLDLVTVPGCSSRLTRCATDE